MQPTMKLRWRKAERGEDCVAFGFQWRNGFSEDWDLLNGRVLQQWWENSYPLGNEAYKGEWRDIEIAEEE